MTVEDIVNHVMSINISQDGYYIINEIKSDIKAVNVYIISFNTGYSASVSNYQIHEGQRFIQKAKIEVFYLLISWF